MILTLRPDHKHHISFLISQTPQVLQDFCKLALDYVQKGVNIKLYNAAAQKLEVDVDIIKNAVEGLVYLLLESCKYKLSEQDFRDSVITIGFTEEKETILSKLYTLKKAEISQILFSVGFSLPEYYDLEWRFETQVASRSLLKQVKPLVLFDLSLKNSENDNAIEHHLLQTDPTNLIHMIQSLEEALQDSTSVKKISRAIK